MFIVEGEGFVIVVNLGQVRIGEYVGENSPLGTHARLQLAVLFAQPTAIPALLVLPLLGITNTRLGLDIVEPRVFDALARGPYILAGDRTGMAPDALVEVQHHCDLRANFHDTTSGRRCVAEP